MGKKKTNKSGTPSFETSLEELRNVVALLEEGNLSLDDSLKQYETGVKHLNLCYSALKAAQRKIEVLVEIDENGKLKTIPFDDQATEFRGSPDDGDEDEDVDGPNSLF